MKYFLPEWNDCVDPNYDFVNDLHSVEHVKDPIENDIYMWDIFGIDKVPVDGILVSRIVAKQDKKKYERALTEGIHKVLRLPRDFEILGDCGAFGYVEKKSPPFDPVEILQYYKNLGFDYGVTVDHLVVPQFEKEKEERIKITFENGVKAYQEWLKNYRRDFQLLVAVQGWHVSDYLKMYRNYINLGVDYLAFGGLARSPTSFIINLVEELTKEIKGSAKVPSYLHFFGLARPVLFPKFQELEELGTEVGFDSASYLRKAWLSSPTSQLNYLTTRGRGYTAIRIPFMSRKRRPKKKEILIERTDHSLLKNLEQECLIKLRSYDKGETDNESAISVLSRFSKSIGQRPGLTEFYRRTLEDKPWKSCHCPICRNIGIDVVIFRGNNRNRRRGFHNTYVFYSVLKNPKIWSMFIKGREEKQETELFSLRKGDNVLVITECTKEKLGYDSSTKTTAKKMYQGRLFQKVKDYSETMGFDYVIISAKYGLLFPDSIIEGYEKVLQTKEDIENIRPLVEDRLRPLLKNYNKVLVIAGEKYRYVLQNLWDDRFTVVRSRGYGDLCSIIEKATQKTRPLIEFMT